MVAMAGLEHKPRNRHQRAGIAGADAGLRFTALDEIDGDAHRGIFLAAQGVGRRLIHGHDFSRVMHPQPVTGGGAGALQFGLDLVLQADQHKITVRIATRPLNSGRHGHAHAVVAAHAIDGNGHIHHGILLFKLRLL
jgi:hypothetical protein